MRAARMVSSASRAIGLLIAGVLTVVLANDAHAVPAANTTSSNTPAPDNPTFVPSPSSVPGAVTTRIATLPPIEFDSAVAPVELLARLRANPRFALLDPALIGSAITLRVSKYWRVSAGGMAGGLLSAAVAGGTLGLIPMLINGDMVVRYDIDVNGTLVASYVYQKNMTRTESILFQNNKTRGLGTAGLEWVLSTVETFIADSERDGALEALRTEHSFYFPSEAPQY